MAIKNGSSGAGGVSSSTKTESSSAVKTGSSAVGGASNTSSAKTTNTATVSSSQKNAPSTSTSTKTTTTSAPKTSTTSLASAAGAGNKNTSSNVSPSASGSTSAGSGYVGGTASAVSGDSGSNNSTYSPSTAAYVGGSSGGGGGGTTPVRAATSAVGGASGTDTTYVDVGLGSAAKGSWGTTPSVSGSTSTSGRGVDAAVTTPTTRALASAAGLAAAVQQGWLPYQSAAAQPRMRELSYSYDGEGTNPDKIQDRLPEGVWPTMTPYEGWRTEGGDFPAMPLVSNLTASRGANGANDNLNMMLAAMAGQNMNVSPRDSVGAGPGGWAQYDDYITDQMLTGATGPETVATTRSMGVPGMGFDNVNMMLNAMSDKRIGGPTVAGRPEYPGTLPAAPWTPTVAGRQETPGGLPGASWLPTVTGRKEVPGALPAVISPRDDIGNFTLEQLDDEMTEWRRQSANRSYDPLDSVSPRLPDVMDLRFNVNENTRAPAYYGEDNPGVLINNGGNRIIPAYEDSGAGPVSPKTNRFRAPVAEEPDRFDPVKVLENLAAARAAQTPGLGINGGYDNANMMIGNTKGVHVPTFRDLTEGNGNFPPYADVMALVNGQDSGIRLGTRSPKSDEVGGGARWEDLQMAFDPRGGIDPGYTDNEGNQIESLPGQVEFERATETETPREGGKSSIKEDSGIVTKGDLDKLKKDNDPLGKWFESTPIGKIIGMFDGDKEDDGETSWLEDMAAGFTGMFGGDGSGRSNAPAPLVDPVVGGSQTPRDANGNGIPDDMERILGPVIPNTPVPNPNPNPNTPTPNNPNNPSTIYDRFGDVVFPALPPYNPGVDPEWLYYRKRGYADGGLVGAYAEGGAVTGLDMQDPRVETIAKAEDALEDIVAGRQPSAEERKALEDFTAQFGQEALKSLYQNVQAGMTMKGKPRMVEGPGGPEDDAIPARVENVEEAALSNGEFVMPAEAVAEMGEGDPMVGAQRLQELSERLTGARRQPEVNVERVS